MLIFFLFISFELQVKPPRKQLKNDLDIDKLNVNNDALAHTPHNKLQVLILAISRIFKLPYFPEIDN